ncbi:Uncharacterized protein TCM_044364 [Theobroma cacao]|uniref:Uncharacterized protein n=1 Tax=Theobroma cacao TaxID=3641 RepID=A0A061FQG1_THECC|nr:Uncharacterized protein TCM_044364 [Theobroma cacao]
MSVLISQKEIRKEQTEQGQEKKDGKGEKEVEQEDEVENELQREKEHLVGGKSGASSLGEFEEILVSDFIRYILKEVRADQVKQQAKMHQEVQLAPPKIEQTVREANPDKGKAIDIALITKKTASKGS